MDLENAIKTKDFYKNFVENSKNLINFINNHQFIKYFQIDTSELQKIDLKALDNINDYITFLNDKDKIRTVDLPLINSKTDIEIIEIFDDKTEEIDRNLKKIKFENEEEIKEEIKKENKNDKKFNIENKVDKKEINKENNKNENKESEEENESYLRSTEVIIFNKKIKIFSKNYNEFEEEIFDKFKSLYSKEFDKKKIKFKIGKQININLNLNRTNKNVESKRSSKFIQNFNEEIFENFSNTFSIKKINLKDKRKKSKDDFFFKRITNKFF